MEQIINERLIIEIIAVVFAAGVLYGKLTNIEKKLDKMDKHGEKISALEARVEIIEKSI